MFKMRMQGSETSLSDEKVGLLETAGFTFTMITWDQRISELHEYFGKHGHLRVPRMI